MGYESPGYHQAFEDARLPVLANIPQTHEGTRWKWLWRPFTGRRKSIELENGHVSRRRDMSPWNTRAKAVEPAALPPKPFHEHTGTGIPYSRLASHHLPPTGPLQIWNNLEDGAEPLRLNSSHTDKGTDGAHRSRENKEVREGEDRPKLSRSAPRDDAANQSWRAQNLLRASQRVPRTTKGNLFYPILQRDDRTKAKKYVVNVAAMQAAAIRYYQTMIVEYGAEMCNGSMHDGMPDVLHGYCDALRDMDYMQEKARNGFDHDPFLLMTTKQMEREMMFDSGLITEEELTDLPPALDVEHPTLAGVGRTARLHAAEGRARTINILCALLGGLALIIPMVIMTLVPSRTSVLVTTTSFVLVFALAVALLSGLKPNEVLAVTAGYAAVLVVFVGAQSGSIGSSFAS